MAAAHYKRGKILSTHHIELPLPWPLLTTSIIGFCWQVLKWVLLDFCFATRCEKIDYSLNNRCRGCPAMEPVGICVVWSL